MKVLAMYDLRGIQKFIYNTNKLREIIGGSLIIADLLEDALAAFIKTRDRENHLLEWKDKNGPLPFRMLSNEDIDSEVLYCGGGNLLVAWRTEELAREAGQFMNRYVLKHAYSLSLSCATTYMSDSYAKDYISLCRNLDLIKSMGYRAKPVMGCPFTVFEQGTGLPAVVRDGEQRISMETLLKRQASHAQYKEQRKSRKYSLVLEDMVDDVGKGFLAVVHIDGNSMGQRIRQRLEDSADYLSAVNAMRALSLRIAESFNDAFNYAVDCVCAHIDQKSQMPLRPIIEAGDDITFICRADLAIQMVKEFIKKVEESAMCDLPNGNPDLENYAFSACAGIVYMHVKFPFSEAYELCEQLCSEAKKKAKLPQNLQNGQAGSYLDFHIENGAILGELKEIRQREYVNADGASLLQRPLNVNGDRRDSLAVLTQHLERFSTIPRSWLKRARNAYCISAGQVRSVFRSADRYIARGLGEDIQEPFDENGNALYYDALELLDVMRKE